MGVAPLVPSSFFARAREKRKMAVLQSRGVPGMHRSTVISLPILLDLHATPLFMRTRDDSTVGPPCQHNEEKIMLAGPTVESRSLFHEEVFQGLVSEHNSREDITTLDLSLE